MNEKSGQTKLRKIRRILIEGLAYILVILASIFILPEYVVQRTIVDGESMQSTLMDEDNLIVNKITMRLTNPKRFDIVVFYPYGKNANKDEDDDYFVKRVIGLPGEEIQIQDGKIYINGEMLEEDYGKDKQELEAGIAKEPILLAKDEYFLMGDNRSGSMDSRDEEIGPVKRNLIEGKVVLRIWPLDQFGVPH